MKALKSSVRILLALLVLFLCACGKEQKSIREYIEKNRQEIYTLVHKDEGTVTALKNMETKKEAEGFYYAYYTMYWKSQNNQNGSSTIFQEFHIQQNNEIVLAKTIVTDSNGDVKKEFKPNPLYKKFIKVIFG